MSAEAGDGREEPSAGGRSDPCEGRALPEPVRARVLQLAADAVGRLAPEHLPASLKKVASFAPSRRARLAGTQIATVLDADEEFRGRVGTQIRAAAGDLARTLEAGAAPGAVDPVEVAAVAYILRVPDWERLVAGAAAEPVREAEAVRRAVEQTERLRRQFSEVQRESQEARVRHKAQLEALRAENSELRRKLGDVRKRLKEAEADAEEASRTAAAETAAASLTTAASEAEARRLRTRVAELERELSALRRTGRSERDAASARARMLLDTLLDATQGLRRELALPAGDTVPADFVAADEALPGERTSSGHGSLGREDPRVLDQLLGLPRAHLIVDGYNVTKTAWPDLSLERQRDRLLAGLGPLAARSGAEVTVVFDAAETRERPLVSGPRGVRVRFSPEGVIADDVIRQFVAAEPAGRPVVVATNDQAVASDVLRAGFRVVAAQALSRLIAGPLR